MSSRQLVVCKFCNRKDFATERGLTQHLRKHKICSKLYLESLPHAQRFGTLEETFQHLSGQNAGLIAEIQATEAVVDDLSVDSDPFPPMDDNNADPYDDFVVPSPQEMTEQVRAQTDCCINALFPQVDEDMDMLEVPNDVPPCPIARDSFREYVEHCQRNVAEFRPNEEEAIRLAQTLRHKKCSLDTYDAIMEWHYRATGKLEGNVGIGKIPGYVSRKSLLKKLTSRYNINPKYFNEDDLILPSTRTKVKIIWHPARECIASLLTDPRFSENDQLFFGSSPFEPPPANLDYYGDTHTGKAYIQTYKHLITKPGKQILVPIIPYIDGACTTKMDKLTVEALRFALGVHNFKAREREHAWRCLGYVPEYTKETSRSRKMFVESGHMAARRFRLYDGEGETLPDNTVHNAQDLHAIIDFLLRSYREVEKNGMLWDFVWEGQDLPRY